MPEMKRYQRIAIFVLGLAMLVGWSGCDRAIQLNVEYGKIVGTQGSDSLDGVSVLADMYKEHGFRVKRRNKISPRIYQYNTLVWFPDRNSCPAPEAVDALNDWLSEGYMRTLIYVGRDYDCKIDYLTSVFDNAPIDQKEEMLRRIAEAKSQQDARKGIYQFWGNAKLTTCDWFDQVTYRRQKSNQLFGPMTLPLSRDSYAMPEIEYATLLAPHTGKKKRLWDSRSMLDVDGQPFAFALTNRFDYNTESSENKIVVVSNGSFLLNYALVDSGNRMLAGQLIDESAGFGDVLFLESGPSEIVVSDTDITNHNSWAWIAEAPLRYIVPHFLAWGILYCFVFFPIFGRPQRLEAKSTSNFRSHVNAIGKLFGRSKSTDQAIQRIHKYQQSIGSESNRNKNDH